MRQGEADDVADAAADVLDEDAAGALDGVGAGLVERLAGADVPVDDGRLQGHERHDRRHHLDGDLARRPARRRRCGPCGPGPDSRRSIRRASSASTGLPRISPSTSTVVSAASTGSPSTAAALATASRRTRSIGRSPGQRRLVDVGGDDPERQPELGEQLRRRGEPDASTRPGQARVTPPVSDRPGAAGSAQRIDAGDGLAGRPPERRLGDRQPRQAQRPAGPARQQADGGARRSAGTPGAGRHRQRRVDDEVPGRRPGGRRAGELGPVGLEHRGRARRRSPARRPAPSAAADPAGLGDVLVGLGRRQRARAVALRRPAGSCRPRRGGPTSAGAGRSPRTAGRRARRPSTRRCTARTAAIWRRASPAMPYVVTARKRLVRARRPHGSPR